MLRFSATMTLIFLLAACGGKPDTPPAGGDQVGADTAHGDQAAGQAAPSGQEGDSATGAANAMLSEQLKKMVDGLSEEQRNAVNPITALDDAQRAWAAEQYRNVCASCHGPEGRGDGAAAPALDPKPRNFTDKAASSATTDGVKFQVLKSGVDGTTMVALAKEWPDEDNWKMVAYLKEFSN